VAKQCAVVWLHQYPGSAMLRPSQTVIIFAAQEPETIPWPKRGASSSFLFKFSKGQGYWVKADMLIRAGTWMSMFVPRVYPYVTSALLPSTGLIFNTKIFTTA